MCGIFFSCLPTKSTLRQNFESKEFVDFLSQLRAAGALRGPDAQSSEYVFVRDKDNSNYITKLEFYASELRLRGNLPIVQPHVNRDSGNILCWNGEIFDGIDIDLHENDGIKLFHLLEQAVTPEDVVRTIGAIEGPFAFVYYQKATQRVFFARDPLGRRSLLVHFPSIEEPFLLLTSASNTSCPLYALEELSTEFLFIFNLNKSGEHSTDAITSLNRFIPDLKHSSRPSVCTLSGQDHIPIISSLDEAPPHTVDAVEELISVLDRSVMLRVRNIPPSPLGTKHARLAILFSGGIDCSALAFFAHKYIPIDEPIDLLNVAFENPRKDQANKRLEAGGGAPSAAYLVPDRVTGLSEVAELRRICPNRQWNFVEVNVSYEESQATRTNVEAVMYPRQTVMDLSLAIALYFASRGTGILRNATSSATLYTSTARVLLNGLGADELLGGYGRHRTTFKHGSWTGLIEELQAEIDRLPTRNLGRDDRIVSYFGKEARHPFLSLDVVRFLADKPVYVKLDPRAELGVGDKMLLRLAMRKVGMLEASERKKKAMQFGSHSARMHGGPGEKKGDLLLS